MQTGVILNCAMKTGNELIAGSEAEQTHPEYFLKKMRFFIRSKNTGSIRKELYPLYKKECDRYFSNHHRQQEMGIGGIFMITCAADEADAEKWFGFQQANGNAFLEGYLPIVEKRKDLPYGENEIRWQEIRRGRYVEFNLLHDRVPCSTQNKRPHRKYSDEPSSRQDGFII
jgi:coproporphyrinogen III oxidase